ncbi:MAG: hypothetical protein SVR08_16015, partial [Spirochaetota bacterium]|nr:hypothetical protein [Spirochaetota bacterium]
MKKILFALMFIFCIKDVLLSAVLFDPGYEWRSIKTEHFWIHYHQNLDYEAKRLSIIAEKVHNNLKDKIRWEPYFRTDVILVDNQYSSNGFAIPIPSNRIQIYISRPELDGLLNNFDDWLELVFIHEYTHILNIDSIHGFPTFTRYTCGRVCFPNIFIPTWLLEGNAVYHESSYSIFGRNNSTYTDMIMRMEILSDSLKSIDKASHFPREWPLGRVPYIYGGLFVEFLEKKYGKGTIADVFIENSYNILPYYDNTIPYILPFIDSSD